MRVILKKDISNLGRAGDIKEVKNGYARNYLIPKDLVMTATARSEKQLKFLDKIQEQKLKKRKKTDEEMANQIKGKEVRITMKVGDGRLFGSVTNIHVQRELENMGFVLDKRCIIINEPIKNLGYFTLPLKLSEGVTSEIKVIVQDEEGNTTIQTEEEDSSQEASSESIEETSEVESENIEQ